MAKDKYAQIAFLSVVESAANTLTFAGLSVFSNVLSNQGMLIHRIEYELAAGSLHLCIGTDDTLQFGLTGDDTISTVSMADPSVYDENRFMLMVYGAPANSELHLTPVVRDWTGMPGGGKLIPADRIFLYVQGVSLVSPATIVCRVHFTLIDMAAADYLELAQSLRVLR